MKEFSRSGLTFPVRDSGPTGGRAVVLLHGFPQDESSFDRVVPLLHEQGLRTLVPTQRGYAPAARPRRRRDYTLTELSKNVVALLDAAGLERAHVVGHDWGGAVAWAVAGWHPDRVYSVTALSTPHPATMLPAMVRSSQGLKSWYMGFFQLPWLPELAMPRMAKGLARSGLPAESVARYQALLAEPAARTAMLNWYRGLPLSQRPPVPDIGVPATYVWGTGDFALGRYAAEHTAGRVTADYRFLPLDAGHWLPETRPAEVAAAIIDRVTGTP